jgi:hypothetical protein
MRAQALLKGDRKGACVDADLRDRDGAARLFAGFELV